MNQIDIHNRKTDLAWKQLYSRLEEDGLLDGKENRTSGPTRIRTVGWAAAIAVLCISVATLFFIHSQNRDTTPFLTLENTEKTTLVTTLEDGSIIYLADQAMLHYPQHFAAEKREVALEGNALFNISGNKERPFIIETDKVQIEVLGTSFQVKNTEDTPFELSVRSGEVRVTAKGSNESLLVKAGEMVKLSSNGLLITSFADADRFNQYTKRIRFKDERLGDILNVLNKDVSRIPFQTNPTLENRTLTIDFEDNTPDEIAYLICLGLQLNYSQENGMIKISEP